MQKYFPILLSKAGELSAISKLSQNVKNGICPIIQVLPGHFDNVKKAFSTWNFNYNRVFLDFSLSNPFEADNIRNLISELLIMGVNVIPVLQQNSSIQYTTILQELINNGNLKSICIRFSNVNGGFLNINNQINNLLTSLELESNQASILIDFGLVESHNYNMIEALAVNIVSSINNISDYNNVIIGSSSFPENLSSLTPAGRLYRLIRFEWIIWQTLQAQPSLSGKIKYADYGTKYPYYSEANFQGSCSIKYTLPNEFIVYRGEISGNHPEGNGQYIIFANRLIGSTDYYGNAFSWGDARLYFYANQSLTNPDKKTGNAKTWVEISQNHHITLITSLL